MSQLKTVYIDPEHHTTSKTEFRLHGQAYLSDLKILINASATDGGYSQSAGVYGYIKHIRLLSGGVELDSCRFANYWMAFKNLNNSNKDNVNLRKRITHNGLGYEMDESITFGAREAINQAPNTTAGSSTAGVLYLSEILPILDELTIINTDSVFPNLRIVIEYNNDDKLQKSSTTNASTLTEPLLICSEVLSPQDISASAKMNGLQWDSIEMDQFIVPAVGAGATQHLVQKLNGFDNKMVSRVLMVKQTLPLAHNFLAGGTVNTLGFGVYNSFVQYKEKVNFNVNSKPIFQSPLDEQGQKQQVLNDTWGKCNILPFASVSSQGLDKQGAVALNIIGVPDLQANGHPSYKVGTQDYIGWACSQRVSNLEVDYQRVGPTDAGMDGSNTLKAQNDSLLIKLYAEVRKQIEIKNGKILVSYA